MKAILITVSVVGALFVSYWIGFYVARKGVIDKVTPQVVRLALTSDPSSSISPDRKSLVSDDVQEKLYVRTRALGKPTEVRLLTQESFLFGTPTRIRMAVTRRGKKYEETVVFNGYLSATEVYFQ